MNVKKVKVENDNGEIIRVFDSVKEAASYYGIHPEGMTYRIKHKICNNGETVSFLEAKGSNGLDKRLRRLKNYSGVFKFNEKKHCKVRGRKWMCMHNSMSFYFVAKTICREFGVS